MSAFNVQRIGVVMEAEPGNASEVEGVLNPGCARGRDGELYLFPRLVARGNYSRIGIARVLFNTEGDPIGVERLGIALEPEADYELRPDGGGCEDPRVTYVNELQRFVMAYTAHSPQGPRIALAASKDLFHWERMGLASFKPFNGVDFQEIDNKDALIFPGEICDPAGQPAYGMIHRPLFPGTHPHETLCLTCPRVIDTVKESLWISYHSLVNEACTEQNHLCRFNHHQKLATPVAPWERLKIGGGTPPILTRHGWLILYHGVSQAEQTNSSPSPTGLCYSAGILILEKEHPHKILYRSREPLLTPELPQERMGVVNNVVFPTAIDRRENLGISECFDVYYGMADKRIGVARLTLPEQLPTGSPPHSPNAKA